MGDPEDIRVLLDQGLTYYGLGKVSEALQTWNRVLELDPDNAKAKEYLNFVQQNWAPPPREDPPQPYRPDEGSDGSGQIQAPPIPETPASTPVAAPPEPAASQTQGGEAGDGFGAAVKPQAESSGWGDLNDFGAVGKGWDPPPAAPDSGIQDAVESEPEQSLFAAPPAPDPLYPPEPAPSPPPVPDPVPAEPQAASTFDAWGQIQQGGNVEDQSRPALVETFADPFESQPWPAVQSAPPPAVQQSQPPVEPAGPPADPGSDALDLVAETLPGMPELTTESVAEEPPAGSEVETWLSGARDLLELDDFSGALELLDKVLEREPQQAEASQLRDQAESQLLGMLSSKLGDLSQVPRVQMPEDEIIWLNYDHRAGFVLSLVDGELSYDEIISVSGLSQLECMRFLVQFLLEKVIVVG